MSQLVVLGSCGAWPEPDRAASGFLLEHGGFRLVLDLGYATLPRLLAHCPDGAVDAVVVTHEHVDHCVDVSGLFRVLYYAPQRSSLVPLYCTPGVLRRVGQLEPTDRLREVFDVHELPGSYQVGPFRLDGVPLPHHVPNCGIRLTAPGLTLAGDTGPDPALAALGADADLFVMEATLQGEPPDEAPRYLMTAREAGRWASRANAARLLLTHFWPGADRSVSVAEARAEFSGEVLVAEEGRTVRLP